MLPAQNNVQIESEEMLAELSIEIPAPGSSEPTVPSRVFSSENIVQAPPGLVVPQRPYSLPPGPSTLLTFMSPPGPAFPLPLAASQSSELNPAHSPLASADNRSQDIMIPENPTTSETSPPPTLVPNSPVHELLPANSLAEVPALLENFPIECVIATQPPNNLIPTTYEMVRQNNENVRDVVTTISTITEFIFNFQNDRPASVLAIKPQKSPKVMLNEDFKLVKIKTRKRTRTTKPIEFLFYEQPTHSHPNLIPVDVNFVTENGKVGCVMPKLGKIAPIPGFLPPIVGKVTTSVQVSGLVSARKMTFLMIHQLATMISNSIVVKYDGKLIPGAFVHSEIVTRYIPVYNIDKFRFISATVVANFDRRSRERKPGTNNDSRNNDHREIAVFQNFG